MAIKKLDNKYVKVRSFKIAGKQLLNPLGKFKTLVCKILKIEPSKDYKYFIQLRYYGTNTLQFKDVLTDSIGNIYVVMDVRNRVANLMNKDPMKSEPNLQGRLNIEGREIKGKK